MTKLTVFTAKHIRTMDAGRTLTDAVAVKDGRIVSVGTLATMRNWLDREEHVIDDRFSDKVIFPGSHRRTRVRKRAAFLGCRST